MLKAIKSIIEKEFGKIPGLDFSVSYIDHKSFGHISTTYALVAIKSPQEEILDFAKGMAQKLEMYHKDVFEKVEVAGPGFINFTLTHEFILENLGKEIQVDSEYKNKKIVVEYTDPNPFKVFHIGHLMTNIIGESVARIYEAAGADVKRVNYQGDIGRHIAINIYAILKEENYAKFLELKHSDISVKEKVKWLGEKYAEGYKDFDGAVDDSQVVKDVTEINKKIYEKSDTKINEIYEAGRSWSLQYFETLYERLDTKFDEYIFESEAAPTGIKIVKENTGKVFEVGDEGAIIYDGEKVGLHKRVFINKNGLPTYEAKDLGNMEEKKLRLGAFDKSIVITGNEQSDYFKVLYAAIDELNIFKKENLEHIGHGMMRFTDGKMSSRKGNIIAGEDLIDDIKNVLSEKFDTSRVLGEEKEKLIDEVAIAALKYSILKQALGRDVIFDFDKAISVEGDSGPYLQYTHARLCSVAQNKKVEVGVTEKNINLILNIIKFEDVMQEVVAETAPQKLSSYLISLAREVNSWYASNRVVGDTGNEYLAYLSKDVLARGLYILGIHAPNKM